MVAFLVAMNEPEREKSRESSIHRQNPLLYCGKSLIIKSLTRTLQSLTNTPGL